MASSRTLRRVRTMGEPRWTSDCRWRDQPAVLAVTQLRNVCLITDERPVRQVMSGVAAAEPTLDGSTVTVTVQGQREALEFEDPDVARETFELISEEQQAALAASAATAGARRAGGPVLELPAAEPTLRFLGEAMRQFAAVIALVTIVIALGVALHRGCGAFTGANCVPGSHPYVLPGLLILVAGVGLSALIFAGGALAQGLVELLDQARGRDRG